MKDHGVVSFRAAATAHVLGHERVALQPGHEAQSFTGVLDAVGRADEDRGHGLGDARRKIDVRRQPHAVAHRTMCEVFAASSAASAERPSRRTKRINSTARAGRIHEWRKLPQSYRFMSGLLGKGGDGRVYYCRKIAPRNKGRAQYNQKATIRDQHVESCRTLLMPSLICVSTWGSGASRP